MKIAIVGNFNQGHSTVVAARIGGIHKVCVDLAALDSKPDFSLQKEIESINNEFDCRLTEDIILKIRPIEMSLMEFIDSLRVLIPKLKAATIISSEAMKNFAEAVNSLGFEKFDKPDFFAVKENNRPFKIGGKKQKNRYPDKYKK